ncbi:hypothetical protein HPB47_003851 [Ixodes persulcatus]|uniref:Uncharacterized protein n=1 Tax=Ixodes persulcatus TaxID=34615 RepID=A0AC60PH97_IXOPE|nr:hypothetical protein HPB47_003851 [Ixodes persulcatus]
MVDESTKTAEVAMVTSDVTRPIMRCAATPTPLMPETGASELRSKKRSGFRKGHVVKEDAANKKNELKTVSIGRIWRSLGDVRTLPLPWLPAPTAVGRDRREQSEYEDERKGTSRRYRTPLNYCRPEHPLDHNWPPGSALMRAKQCTRRTNYVEQGGVSGTLIDCQLRWHGGFWAEGGHTRSHDHFFDVEITVPSF